MGKNLSTEVESWIERLKANDLDEKTFRREFKAIYREYVEEIFYKNKNGLKYDNFSFIFQLIDECDTFSCMFSNDDSQNDETSRTRQFYKYYSKWIKEGQNKETKKKLFIAQVLFYANRRLFGNKNISSVEITKKTDSIAFKCRENINGVEEEMEGVNFEDLNNEFKDYSFKEFQDHCKLILLPESKSKNENEKEFNAWLGDKKKDIIEKTKNVDHIIFYNITYTNFEQLGTLFVEYLEGGKEPDLKKLRADACEAFLKLKHAEIQVMSEFDKKKIHEESIKSAKAAIMSRNLSHNLGSHVMVYLKQYLESVKDIIQQKILLELIKKDCFDEKPIDGLTIDETSTLPFLVGMGRFISYLQERQDFIATICTDYISYYSTINFKDFIYDELNPDCRSVRHPDVKGRKADNILLKFIAQSEELTRDYERDSEERVIKFKDKNIIIKFREFNGINAGVEYILPKNEKAERALHEMRKYLFSLPGGIVGRQAFFSIIENIIRNAAKHGDKGTNANLELTIDILDKNSKQLSADLEKYIETEEIKKDDLYIITITDNTEKNKDIIDKIKKALEEDYIDGQGKLLETNKGIKEMRISACYLRGIKVTEENKYQDPGNTETPILQVFATKNDNLQYVFCIPKPKNIAFIVNDLLDKTLQECNEILQEYHCKIFTIEQFKNEKNKNYEFIVAQDSKENNVYNKILPFSHSRIVRYDFSGDLKENFACFKNEKDCIKKINDYFYRFWKKILENEEELQKITIIDEIAKGKDEYYENLVIYSNDESVDADMTDFIYRYHHSSDQEYKNFVSIYTPEIRKGIQFIETITGSNSTDRLIRQEKLNDLWYYKHLFAMQTRVAIIDERLFTKITKIKQPGLSNPLKNEECDKTSIFFRQKNIDFFTLIYNREVDSFGLWGEKFVEKNDENSIYDVLAHFNSLAEFEFKLKEENKYDFIVIHQGLLDKIYEKVKNCDKQKITEIFFDKFSKKNKIPYIDDDGTNRFFLPGFLIHSGRSKPSKNDMPQKQPFIQFSALENAVGDCKYSLVELLTQAYYEE